MGGTYDDGDVEDHAGDVVGVLDPEGDDELTEGGAKGVGEGSEGRGADAAPVGEPQVGVAGGRGEDKGLRGAGEDLAEHDEAEDAALGRVAAGVAEPVAH